MTGRVPESLAHLLALADAGQNGRPAPAESVEWFSVALSAWLADGLSLEEAFQVRAQGNERTARTIYRRQRRDAYLRRAWALCEAATPTARARELEQHCSRFESIIWPRWRAEKEPPADASRLRAALFHARRWGGPLPAWRTLLDVCNECPLPVALNRRHSVHAHPEVSGATVPTGGPEHEQFR